MTAEGSGAEDQAEGLKRSVLRTVYHVKFGKTKTIWQDFVNKKP